MARALYAALEAGPKTRRERLEQRRLAMWTERSSFDDHWREIGDFIKPTRTRFWTSQRNQGGKRNQNIIDSTATFSSRTLGSGFHAGMSSPARPWYELGTPDPALKKHKPVALWLEETTRRMRAIMADTNLYLALPEVYEDLGLFGTAPVSLLDDSKDLFRAYTYPIGSYAIGLDARGVAATFVHEYELSVYQVVEQFAVVPGYRDLQWENISTAVKTLWDRGNYEAAVPVVWFVQPNLNAEQGRIGAEFMPFASCHYERDDDSKNKILRESGFETFPVMVPRWRVTGNNTYGDDCPGMTALGDVKQLQLMQKDEARAIKKMIDPPVQGPPELRNQKTSLLPGDITYVRDSREGSGLRSVHEVNISIAELLEKERDLRFMIQRAFYEDLFLMVTRSDQLLGAARPTAREIDERHEEKLIALGPTLERCGDELHDRMIDRVFWLMTRAGLVPPAPPELNDVPLNVEYVSILAAAQMQYGIVAQDRFLVATANMATLDASARHKIKTFEAIDEYAAMYRVTPTIIRTNEEAEQMAAAEAQQQQAIAQAQQAQMTAKAAKDLGTTPIGTGTALDAVATGLQGVA